MLKDKLSANECLAYVVTPSLKRALVFRQGFKPLSLDGENMSEGKKRKVHRADFKAKVALEVFRRCFLNSKHPHNA